MGDVLNVRLLIILHFIMILEIRDNCEHPYMLTFISFLNYKEWLMLSLKTYLGVMKLIQNFLNKN